MTYTTFEPPRNGALISFAQFKQALQDVNCPHARVIEIAFLRLRINVPPCCVARVRSMIEERRIVSMAIEVRPMNWWQRLTQWGIKLNQI